MKARHTYGTSGARIILTFHCNGEPMGSVLQLGEGQEPAFTVEVGGAGELSEVAIIRQDGSEWTEPFQQTVEGTDRWSGTWRDEGAVGTGIYYLRVTQADGEQAWTSPVWIERTP